MNEINYVKCGRCGDVNYMQRICYSVFAYENGVLVEIQSAVSERDGRSTRCIILVALGSVRSVPLLSIPCFPPLDSPLFLRAALSRSKLSN